jgi:hypothetical protein
MPLVKTRGAASAQGFGEFAQASAVNYIEDVFSTWLYTGTGAAQTVTNGIDLSTKGGLVWVKDRSQGYSHILVDTARGISSGLSTDTTGAAGGSGGFTSFDTTGFSFGSGFGVRNNSGDNYVSWTFRKQPKFFDVVTYTGNGASTRYISHDLGAKPGMIIIKCTNNASNWPVGFGNSIAYLYLNSTAASPQLSDGYVENYYSTATSFLVDQGNGTSGPGGGDVNLSGRTYVAYLFAHNAGGFGLTGTDNVISCGSFTTDGSGNATVNLGYEPQWLMWKRSDGASSWRILDSMRGFNAQPSTSSVDLEANTSSAEYAFGLVQAPNATGFSIDTGSASASYIYIAIRRGPMKVPTLGTTVYNAVPYTGDGTNNRQITGAGFTPDLVIPEGRNSASYGARYVYDRLRGPTQAGLSTDRTDADTTGPDVLNSFDMNGMTISWPSNGRTNQNGGTYAGYMFKRAPGFFDEVCYTGNYAGNPQIPHNLTVAPELIIAKDRSNAGAWYINSPLIGTDYQLAFNTSPKSPSSTYTLTSTYFQNPDINYPTGSNHVAYLFATCPGVSKVGSYTGNGTTQTINCGFTGGARFVFIKRTDATGDWYTYDTGRGMTVLTDPYLLLNSSVAEVATLGSVTTVATGFALNSTILAAINVSAGTYIFLAIA